MRDVRSSGMFTDGLPRIVSASAVVAIRTGVIQKGSVLAWR